MLFIASKLFWAFAAPDNLLLLLVLAGLLAQTLGHRRGYWLALAAALGLLAIGILPVGEWAIAPLEARFPDPVLPTHIDGIIVLGGAVEPTIDAHGQVALDDAAERITEAMALAQRHPEAKLLLSGGDASVLPRSGELEADETRRLFVELGVAPGRILVEDRSRNTFENALFSLKVGDPKPGETWVLVTSAWHMPRAVGCFRAVGWKVLPYPVDYHAETDLRPDFELGKHLALLAVAGKEWVGLAAYRLLGRTDALFPGP